MQISKKLSALGITTAVVVGITTQATGQFNSLSKIPNPESGRWLGDAYYYWDGFEGVTYARMNWGDELNIEFWNKGKRRSDGEWISYGYGVAQEPYKLMTYTWSAYDWTDGQSRVQGVSGGSGYASGDIWEN